jgi:hypothetical protein
MKKNRRILSRNLAKELCESELCQVTGGLEEDGIKTRSILVHHTHSATSHDDCHVDGTDTDEIVPVGDAEV